MKILIVAHLKRKVTPDMTASRSRVIYELAKGLIKKGHDVTILGTGDSHVPGAKIISVIPRSFVEMPAYENPFYAETGFLIKMAKMLEEIAGDYDIVHNNTYPEFINLMAADRISIPIVTTVHAQATPEFDEVLSLFPGSFLISISKAHRELFKKAKIYEVIYNGIDTDLYKFQEKKEDYLLWIGRLGKAKNKDGNFIDAKGVKWAIELARATGSRLKLSGNVEDIEFYNKEVKPHLSDKIEWVGEVSAEQPLSKQEVVELMQNAKAFLMTINWYEPFGLVMAEAMSCGTPVIGFNRGSVSELVEDGKTGVVVEPKEGLDGLKRALAEIDRIEPVACRKRVEEKFSVGVMTNNYEKLYNDVIGEQHVQ